MSRITIGSKQQEEYQVLLNKLHVQALAEIIKASSDQEIFFDLLDNIYWYGQILGEVSAKSLSRESYDWLEMVIAEGEGKELIKRILDREYEEIHAQADLDVGGLDLLGRAIDFGRITYKQTHGIDLIVQEVRTVLGWGREHDILDMNREEPYNGLEETVCGESK